MPEDELNKWLSDADFCPDWQDVDLILADVSLLPRLTAYLEGAGGAEKKKDVIMLALLNILEETNMAGQDMGLAEEITLIIKKHAHIAERAMMDLGPIPEIMLRKILGKDIPKDTASWLVDLADQKLQFRHLP